MNTNVQATPTTAELPAAVAAHVPEALQAAAKQRVEKIAVAATSVGAEVNLQIDVNALISTIQHAINSNSERGAFVKTTLETVTSMIRGRHNIMVFNMQQNYEFNPNWEWAWFYPVSFGSIQYGVFVFSGPDRFVNHGDGGWINWGFYGNVQRDGNTVNFGQL